MTSSAKTRVPKSAAAPLALSVGDAARLDCRRWQRRGRRARVRATISPASSSIGSPEPENIQYPFLYAIGNELDRNA